MKETEIVARWGSLEEFCKERERFLSEHDRADARTFDASGNLVSAVYYFRPYQVAVEHFALLEAIRDANEEVRED